MQMNYLLQILKKILKKFLKKQEMVNLHIEDLQGGTFTISNGGVYGSMLSTPILNLTTIWCFRYA